MWGVLKNRHPNILSLTCAASKPCGNHVCSCMNTNCSRNTHTHTQMGHNMWLTALITASASYVRHHSSQMQTHMHSDSGRGDDAALSQGGEKKRVGKCVWTQGIRGLSVCVRVTVTENVWGTEGGRRGRVNGNHQSQRSSDTQQESLSLVYTCCYTLVHTWAGAHWFGKHNLGGCCCCFKASQRVHKLS